jgi:uncharacterized membrane protein YjjB (DUF3815 family)
MKTIRTLLIFAVFPIALSLVFSTPIHEVAGVMALGCIASGFYENLK